MSSQPVLDRLGWAIEVLQSLGEGGRLGNTSETLEGYVFTREVQAKYLGGLGELLAELGQAGFTLDLKVQYRDSLWPLTLKAGAQGLVAKLGKKEDIAAPLPALSDEAFEAVDDLEGLLSSGGTVAFVDVAARVDKVAVRNVPVQAVLSVSLTKKAVNEEIETSVSSRDARVITFLSPLRLAGILMTTSPEDLENRFFTAGSRTVFVVPGMAGSLAGDLLGAFGSDSAAELDTFLKQGLPSEPKKRTEEALKFCDWQCDWPERPQWMTPETFSLTSSSGNEDAGRTALREQFGRLRSLLCVLFLARRTRKDRAGRYEANFGYALDEVIRFPVTDPIANPHAADLYELYRLAYSGSFAEKLELVRQLLARPSQKSLTAVFDNARAALLAAPKAHENYLKKKVDEYFDAQRKSREYIQETVRDSEKSVMDMTQEVAESVYKIFGAVALVVVAQVLDPKVSDSAALVASVVLTVYLVVIVFFYLPTARRAQEVRRNQFMAHVRSFGPVLSENEIQELLGDPFVQQAWGELQSKSTWALWIYRTLLVASGAAVAFYLGRLTS